MPELAVGAVAALLSPSATEKCVKILRDDPPAAGRHGTFRQCFPPVALPVLIQEADAAHSRIDRNVALYRVAAALGDVGETHGIVEGKDRLREIAAAQPVCQLGRRVAEDQNRQADARSRISSASSKLDTASHSAPSASYSRAMARCRAVSVRLHDTAHFGIGLYFFRIS